MFFHPRRNDVRGKVHGGRGGRSKAELSAQEELAKAREERERRKRQKLEQKSSVVIQASWRGWSSRCLTRRAARTAWDERYGTNGQNLQPGDCFGLKAGGAVGALLFFYQPDADCQRLANVARVFAGAIKSDGFAALVSAYNQPETRAVLLYRLKALALQCLATLSWHRHQLAPVLAAVRPAAPLDPATGGLAGALQECLLLLVSPDTYGGVLGKPQATSLSAAILSHVAENGMCGHMFLLMAAVLLPTARRPPPPARAGGPSGSGAAAVSTPHAVASKPYMEALVTQLTVRLLTLKSFAPAAPEDSFHCLLFVPDLWRRCSSLQPVAPRVCRLALSWLAAAGVHRLVALLPSEDLMPGGHGAAVAVLVTNVLAVGPRLLQPDKTAATAASLRGPALATARVLHAVVSLLPLEPFFPDPAGAADDDDEVDEAACGSLGIPRLVMPPGSLDQLPPGMVEQVQGLTGSTGRHLIKQLVTVLLPQPAPPLPPSSPALATLPTLSSSPGGGFAAPAAILSSSPPTLTPGLLQYQPLCSNSLQPPSTMALLEAAEAAHALSELVWQLMQLPGQQQRVLLGVAVSCDFVEHMWWSFLRPARLADLCGITWLPDPVGPGGCGTSPTGTRATCSTSSSFNCTGGTPMEVELPSAMMAHGTSGALPAGVLGSGGGGGGGGGGFGAGGGIFPGRPRSRSSSGCAGMEGLGTGGGGRGVIGSGQGGDASTLSRQSSGGGAAVMTWRPRVPEEQGWLLPLAVTCSAFCAHITTATLEEFYGGAQRPLPLQQLFDPLAPEAGFLAMLRDALWQVLWSDWETGHSPGGEALYAVLSRTGGQLYGVLYERNCRRAFCPTEAFRASALAPDRFLTEATSSRSNAGREDGSSRVWQVLRHAPSLVPFADRARLFQLMVGKEREEYRAQEDTRFLELGLMGGGLGNRFVTIRRDQLLFDGFDRLNTLGESLKGRVRIQFIDAHGQAEAGVDGGGLFKDFMEELMRAGMSAEYGLFAANTVHQLYPNPAAMRVVEDAPRLLAFLGRMLGKAMYENVLLELPLAGFFLKKFRGAHCDLNDLPTLDPELYRNLLRLRDHLAASQPPSGTASPDGSTHGGGEAAPAAMDLGLTFVVADDAAALLGDPHAEVELKPGGRNIAVTGDNVREYIHRVAQYKLNLAPRPAVSAFLSGFYELIPRSWVSMFSGEELQTLISGAEQSLDLDDLRANVEFAGGYHQDHPVIHCLWEALASFTPEEQGKFLKFVTSCSRAPLLGFRYLEPRLCIQMSGAMLDPAAPQRLPTASTCMNLLKLPPYRTTEAMRQKLLYAITSSAGFDLS